jgi:hypothetical protein
MSRVTRPWERHSRAVQRGNRRSTRYPDVAAAAKGPERPFRWFSVHVAASDWGIKYDKYNGWFQ